MVCEGLVWCVKGWCGVWRVGVVCGGWVWCVKGWCGVWRVGVVCGGLVWCVEGWCGVEEDFCGVREYFEVH